MSGPLCFKPPGQEAARRLVDGLFGRNPQTLSAHIRHTIASTDSIQYRWQAVIEYTRPSQQSRSRDPSEIQLAGFKVKIAAVRVPAAPTVLTWSIARLFRGPEPSLHTRSIHTRNPYPSYIPQPCPLDSNHSRAGTAQIQKIFSATYQ